MEKRSSDRSGQEHTGRYDYVRAIAAEKFGADAAYVYRTSDGTYAMLTLDEALQICGEEMQTLPDELLLDFLEEYNDAAIKVQREMGDRAVAIMQEEGKNRLENRLKK